MTRWIITAIAFGAIAALAAAPGCAATGVGDPCTPDQEYDPTFQGFDVHDVSVESKSYVCLTRLCLVNHFQGRVTCPWGQTAPGVGPAGPTGSPAANANSQAGCAIPGSVIGANGQYPAADQITATNAVSDVGAVPAQLAGPGPANRTANQAVYCSCRCANINGKTDDGANYCSCPENYTCTPLVTSIGPTDQGLTGSYCVLNGSEYNVATQSDIKCNASITDPTMAGSGYCSQQY